MTYYLKVSPIVRGNNLIGPKEILKAKGMAFDCFMAPDGKGAWIYRYEAENESIVQELIGEWPSCASMSEADALAQIDAWKDPVSVLAEIDLKSIRSLREYIATKEDAPEFIKNYEKAAAKERAKLKK